jgi:hypothetical protein
VFLKHLERVDTSQGPVNKVILRFRLNREVELVFNAFVRIYGCTYVYASLNMVERKKFSLMLVQDDNPNYIPRRTRCSRSASKECKQSAISHYRKALSYLKCAQYTSVLVTPEAQAAFLSQKSGRGREILAKYVPSTSRWAQPNISAHGVEVSHTTAAHPKNLSAESMNFPHLLRELTLQCTS